MKQDHKQEQLNIAAKLPIEKDFQIPDGLILPSSSRVLVKRSGQQAFISSGGIIMPESNSKKKGIHGIVMAIGPSVNLEEYPIKLGIKIEFTDGLEEDTLHNGIAYLLIDQFHIKGIVPDGNYKHPKYPTNAEIRRQNRMDDQVRASKLGDDKINEIQNK